MYIHVHMTDHSLIIISLLIVQETRNEPGLKEIMVTGEKLSCGERRTSGELNGCIGERKFQLVNSTCKLLFKLQESGALVASLFSNTYLMLVTLIIRVIHSNVLQYHFQIVLIGDHKQLRPIVKNERVRRLGMAKSLFERYHTMHQKRTVMLDTQYRMVRTLKIHYIYE